MDKYNKSNFEEIVKAEREVTVEKATNETTTLVKEQREAALDGNNRENHEEDRSLI